MVGLGDQGTAETNTTCFYRNMQTCFRQYPDIYGSELADEEDDETPGGDAVADPALVKAIDSKSKEQKTEEVIPKEATDATAANLGKKQ